MTTQRKASYEQNTNEESLDTALLDKVTQELKAQKLGKSRKKTGMSFFGGSSFICAVSSVAAFFAAPYLLPYILTVLVLSGAGAVISAGVALNSYIKENNTTKINISPDSQDNSDASSKKEIIGENIKNEAKSIVNTIQTQVNNSTSINQKNNNPSHQNSRS